MTGASVDANPFSDIVPREGMRRVDSALAVGGEPKKKVPKGRATKDFKLLSFGDEAEDDEGEVEEV